MGLLQIPRALLYIAIGVVFIANPYGILNLLGAYSFLSRQLFCIGPSVPLLGTCLGVSISWALAVGLVFVLMGVLKLR